MPCPKCKHDVSDQLKGLQVDHTYADMVAKYLKIHAESQKAEQDAAEGGEGGDGGDDNEGNEGNEGLAAGEQCGGTAEDGDGQRQSAARVS